MLRGLTRCLSARGSRPCHLRASEKSGAKRFKAERAAKTYWDESKLVDPFLGDGEMESKGTTHFWGPLCCEASIWGSIGSDRC